MSLALTLAVLTLLLAAVAAWASLRRPPADPTPFDALRRHADELSSRDRTESHQALVAQLQPLVAELGGIRTAQAEKLAEGFRLLVTTTQDALKSSRDEQAAQLNQVQQQVEKRLAAIQTSTEERLEQMRRTVDEKLHEALEKRLG